MRQGNSKQRMRGRGGSNGGGGGGNGGGGPRKGPSPLSRSYESTGPDVKVRGTALHIAEKYVALARDAQSSGDPVLAENYLQHAEHYYRIIAAAQASMPPSMQIVRSDLQSEDDEEEFEEGQEARTEPRAEPRYEQRPEPRYEQRPERRTWENRGGDRDRDGEGRSEGRGENRFEGRSYEPRGDRGAPRSEARPEPRVVEPRAEVRVSDDGFMPLDAPQPFVDDVPTAERAAERPRDDRRLGERGRGRGLRNGPRPERVERSERDAPALEAAPAALAPAVPAPVVAPTPVVAPAPVRERRHRAERPAVVVDHEPDLNALPAFLTAAPPRIASATPVEEAAGDDGEARPVRRTRGGRGRGRRPEYEGGEAGAPADEAPATAPVVAADE